MIFTLIVQRWKRGYVWCQAFDWDGRKITGGTIEEVVRELETRGLWWG